MTRLALALAVLLTACTGSGDGTADPSPAAPTAPVVTWGEALSATGLPGGWTIADCEGDAPLYCIEGSGGASGAVEYLTFPADTVPPTLEGIAADATSSAVADREAGCPDGYTATPVPPQPATFAGGEGVRFGFEVRDADGVVVERHTTFATLSGDRLHLVAAEGLTERACVPPEGPTFTPDALASFADVLADVVAASRLP